MNIGFDAKRAFYNTTGLGNYSRTLIRSLSNQYPKNNYFLFTPKQSSIFGVAGMKNVKVVTPSKLPAKVFKSAWRSLWMVNDLEKNKIDIFHGLSHEIPRGIEKTGIKTVVTMHDLIHEKFPEQYKAVDRKIYTSKFKFACQHATKIIAISQQTKKDLIEIYKTPAEKIEVIYQSADTQFSKIAGPEEKKKIKAKYNLPERFMVCVGSIIERKNLLQVCKAMVDLRDNYLKLVVIGEGDDAYAKSVKDFVAANDLRDKVIFLNEKQKVVFSDLPAIYQLSRGAIYISSYEGFGLPVLEAIMSNVPVITSNVSCLPEAGGDAAFYVDPTNVNEIKSMIERISLDKNAVAQKLGIYPSHLAKFDNKKLTEEMEKLYRGL